MGLLNFKCGGGNVSRRECLPLHLFVAQPVYSAWMFVCTQSGHVSSGLSRKGERTEGVGRRIRETDLWGGSRRRPFMVSSSRSYRGRP